MHFLSIMKGRGSIFGYVVFSFFFWGGSVLGVLGFFCGCGSCDGVGLLFLLVVLSPPPPPHPQLLYSPKLHLTWTCRNKVVLVFTHR